MSQNVYIGMTLKPWPILLDHYTENLRFAYIGTDNFELGKSLGEQLKKLRPNGGTLIMHSGRPDSPNLNLRLMGVRSALSGKNTMLLLVNYLMAI